MKKFCARLRLGSRQAAYLGQARRRILNVAHGAAGLVWNCSCSSRPCDGSHFLPVLLVKGDAATAVILPVDGLSSVVAWQAVRSILEQQASPKPNRVKRTAVPTAEIAHSKGKLLPSLIYISSDHQETNYKVIIGGYLTCKNWSAFCFLYNQ